MKGEMGVKGIMCIPCVNSRFWVGLFGIPKYVVWSALFIKRIPVTKFGMKGFGWIVLSGDINIYEFIALQVSDFRC